MAAKVLCLQPVWASCFILLTTLTSPCVYAVTPADSLLAVEADGDFVPIDGIPGVKVDLRYAGTGNFLGQDLYHEFNKAFLRSYAAAKLQNAAGELQKVRPGWRLLVLDALRPKSVQQVLWAAVVGTPKQPYVANPAKGSIHNYGFAVDVTLLDSAGVEVDMGTPFDDFSPMAEPRKEGEFLKKGSLSTTQLHNRRLLRAAMEQAGFIQLPLEWWHFDAMPAAEVRANFRVLE